MKKIFYLLFALLFRIFKIFPVNPKKVTFILSHDTNLTGNMGHVYKEILNQNLKYHLVFFSREEYELNIGKGIVLLLKKGFEVFFIKNYHLATSKIVVLDNIFLASAYFTFRKNVKVIQLWHAAGVLKKFGVDACSDERLKAIVKRATQNITDVVVNSRNFVDIYAKAFHVKKEIIHPLGVPRTDFFFDPNKISDACNAFYNKYSNVVGKKIILYAPTFRENELITTTGNTKIHFDVGKLYSALYPEYILAVRLHPRINQSFKKEYSEFILDVSDYDDISHLLVVSDILITDYSSLIAEYALLNRPMVFYPYDLNNYLSSERGFYFTYTDFVPGPIAYNEEELIMIIKKGQFDLKKVEKYKKECFDFFDGKASKRVVDLFFK